MQQTRTASIWIVAATALTFSAGEGRAAECPAGLVSHWPFDDGTAADSIGGNDGVLHGVTAVSDGFLGQAAGFDGDDSIDVPPSPSLEPAVLTVEAWIRGDTWSCMHGFCSIVASGDSDGSPSGYYLVVNSDGRARFVIAHGLAETQVVSAMYLPVAEWIHVAATVEGTAIRLYVNGAEAGSTPQNAPIFYEHQVLQIGSGVLRYFKGAIDEVALHDHALSAAEIQQHYLNGLAGKDYCAPPDFDGDAVADNGTDLCPGTPAHEVALVDAAGCGPSQRDTDGDGISDAGDACIASPASDHAFIAQSIAQLGCGPAGLCPDGVADPDHDGFGYGSDLCPWTDLSGAPAHPVIDGCSCVQILQMKPGENTGEWKKGCSAGTLSDFRNRTGWAQKLPRPPH